MIKNLLMFGRGCLWCGCNTREVTVWCAGLNVWKLQLDSLFLRVIL